ncbi:hypothetical protein M758_5G065100 [Ceratodon purpureus]|nr:hypothetical protein M758_5G065100 [Ceratodon purpureus]
MTCFQLCVALRFVTGQLVECAQWKGKCLAFLICVEG